MTWDERGDEFLKGLAAPDDEAVKYLSLWVRGRRMALPPDEPSYRLLHRLAVAHQKMERLGELGAILLQKWIDGEWKVVNFEEAAYNLLHVATELRDGRQLGRLIWMLYQRRIVQGDYLGTQLTEPLLEAMIANQTSGDEVELWDRLLMGTVDEYVGGSVEQGERGLAGWVKPDEIGAGIAHLVGFSLGQSDPEAFLLKVIEIHPGVAGWDRQPSHLLAPIIYFRILALEFNRWLTNSGSNPGPDAFILGKVIFKAILEVQNYWRLATASEMGNFYRDSLKSSGRALSPEALKQAYSLGNVWTDVHARRAIVNAALLPLPKPKV